MPSMPHLGFTEWQLLEHIPVYTAFDDACKFVSTAMFDLSSNGQ